MSVSIEALAMAGVDYMEYGMDVDEWQKEDQSGEPPPQHLLADYQDEVIMFFDGSSRQNTGSRQGSTTGEMKRTSSRNDRRRWELLLILLKGHWKLPGPLTIRKSIESI